MILPIYAGLERVPTRCSRRRPTSGPGRGTTLRRVVLPMAFPAIVAGSIFTFSLSMGDYIAVQDRRRHVAAARQRRLRQPGRGEQPAVRGRGGDACPIVVMLVYLAAARRTGALEQL